MRFSISCSRDYLLSSDVWNVVTVVDQMAQSIEHETSGCLQKLVGMLTPRGVVSRQCAAWFVRRLTFTCWVNKWRCIGSGIMIWRYEVTKELYDRVVARGRAVAVLDQGGEHGVHAAFVACVVGARRPLYFSGRGRGDGVPDAIDAPRRWTAGAPTTAESRHAITRRSPSSAS